MIHFLIIPLFSLLNRARGSQVYNLVKSTVLGRLISMTGMALLTSFLAMGNNTQMLELFAWSLVSLMLWCTPAWDKYWSEEIGHSATHSPLYGLMQMTVRMQLILPYFLGVAFITDGNPWYSGCSLLLGLPYYIFGSVKTIPQIAFSEYAVGAIIGTAIILIS